MDQEAERCAGGDRREDARVPALQIEGDDAEGRGTDSAHACRQPVDPVGQVHDVDDQNEPGDRDRTTRIAEVDGPDERQRDVRHLDPGGDRDRHGDQLPGELDGGMQVVAIVDRTDQRDHDRPEQDAVDPVGDNGRRVSHDEARQQNRGKHRQATEQRRRALPSPRVLG